MEMRRKQLREEKAKERQEEREGQITMYRQYRIGDLPDIEINHSSIIVPLQALAQNDNEICKILFQSLISSICCSIQNKPTEYSEIIKKISDAINNILKESIQYNSTVVAFCEEVLHHNIKEMSIDCEEISIASQVSNKQNLGVLLCEDILILDNFELTHSKKRANFNTVPISENISVWIKMAEIYKSLNNYDIVRGIFSHSIQTQPETKIALELEARGDFAAAVKLYSELYHRTEWPNGEPDQAEIDMWDDSIIHCYDSLTRWDYLETSIINHFQNPNEETNYFKIWEENYYQEHYMPFLIRSKLKLLIEKRKDETLLYFVDSSMKENNKKDYLEKHFSEELALLYIIQENYDRAQYYANNSIQDFLKEWISLNVFTPSVREMKLQTLQKLIELQEFLNFMDTQDNFRNEHSFKLLASHWLERLPNIFDSVNVWDDIITNRSLYMEKIISKYQEINGSEMNSSSFNNSDGTFSNVSEFNSENFLMEHNIIMKFKFIESALHQNNISVALKHLKWMQQITKKLGNDDHWISYIHGYCKTYLEKARKQTDLQQMDTLLHAHEQLAKLELKYPAQLNLLTIKHYSLQSQILEMIADNPIINEMNKNELYEKKIRQLQDIFNITCSSEMISNLLHQSFEYKNKSINILQNLKETEFRIDQTVLGETFLELANFCNRCLRKKEESENETLKLSSIHLYPTVLVNSLLEALRYDNLDAMRLFPRLLQIIEIYPEAISDFIKKASAVPCWMFLSWINQLVSLLDKPEAFAVQNIVKEISLNYPNALIYPLKLSMESYNFPNTSQGQKNKQFVINLKDSLNELSLIDDFIAALNHLSIPDIEFREFHQKLCQLKKQKANKTGILNCFKTMWDHLFTNEKSEFRVDIGERQKQIVKKFSKDISSKFGKDGSKIISMGLKELNNHLQTIYNGLRSMRPKSQIVSLESLSTWLANFQSLRYSSEIEIPGQYNGKRKPLLKYHVKICSFDQNVRILDSLTLPHRLTIRGNDEKEYPFLVKSGEDLRQDNRIEQLFSLMNDIYSSDAVCSQHKLKLETYKVVPLTSRIGLIEWVDNTKVLKLFLENAFTNQEQKQYDSSSGPRNVYSSWILSKQKNTNINDHASVYGNIYKVSNAEVCKKFTECFNLVPWDLFRRAFFKLSASLEAFVLLRSNFITSHAVLCISQWLLGIGDRHPKNFLISLSSGVEIGIDFGHAFGTATQFLPVPELIPFRLTNQYLNLMLPFKEKGIIQATMISTLNALRKNCNILLNTMDVFIKEPTVNWQENALKQKDAGVVNEDIERDINWYPKQRILFAQQKLEGINPCQITNEELKLGHIKKSFFEYYQKSCLRENSIRNNLPKNGLSVEQQVSALIDQATDPNILGRTYYGWEPWL